ncbi:MAG: iron-containing alcohol dehydrogenase [Candidatus Omnitrophica bacterium]|nr:iron-containing alcohol dehydrogenase [Candidatus Omnitrophota bacterium]
MDFPQEVLGPQRVIFKRGSHTAIGREACEFGTRGVVVHGRSLEKNGFKDKIAKRFPRSSRVEFFCRPGGEPILEEITLVIETARRIQAEWIVGIGGGSVLDLAKAAAGLYHAGEKPVFYQEGGVLEKTGIPFIACPTTAGTGSEATPNSVIINPDKKTKLSIRDKSFMARTVILDSELLKGLGRAVMSFAAMDAWVQAYESYISKNATWYSETLALKAMELVSRHLFGALDSGSAGDLDGILLGSYLAGVALASSRLGVIHGIAHPLGVLYDQPHGLVCSVCFVPSIRLNRQAMGEKYDTMSRAVGGDLVGRVGESLARLGISSPFKGKPVFEKEKIIQETLQSGSTTANPKPIVREDVEFILREIF